MYRQRCGGSSPFFGTKIMYSNPELKLNSGATARDVEKAIQGHILGQAELMGKYQKSSRRVAWQDLATSD